MKETVLMLLSFLSTFIFLVSAAYLLTTKLAAAGYDISRLILIGLDTKNTPPSQLDMPINTQFIALALAVASSVFIYVKFAASLSFSLFSLPHISCLPFRTRSGPQLKGVPAIRP